MIWKAYEPKFPVESVAFIVKLYVLATVGVPLITPVELFKVVPVGSVPESKLYV
jgi:hypothetical protein